MAYDLPAWTNNPSTTSPLDADNLLLINAAINDLDDRETGTLALVEGNVASTLATAQGDMLAASGIGAFGTLDVGTDGQVLTADSSQPLGVDWADPAPGGVSTVDAGDSSVAVDNTDPANPTITVVQANLVLAESQVTGLTTDLSTLTTAVSGKASSSHTHAESDVTSLTTDLSTLTTAVSGKASSSHTHAESDVTSLTTDLSTLTTAVSGKASTTHTHAESDVTSLVSDLGNKATDSAVVHNTGAETVAGIKTFSSAPVVPSPGAAGNPVRNDDGRLSNSRAPSGTAGGSLAGSYPNPTIAASAITGTEVASAIKDPIAATAGLRTLGTGSAQACAGNDSRLSDARTPTAHASTHASGGSDPIGPSDIDAVPNSVISALGDLIVGAAASTPDTLTVGTDGQVLLADSTQTLGVVWGAAPGGSWSTQVETLADGATVSPNANSGNTKAGSCTSLSQSTTLNAPANGYVGATYRAQLTASGTGPWVITLSGWVGTTDNATSTISLPTGKTVSILGEYCGAGWLYGGYTLQA